MGTFDDIANNAGATARADAARITDIDGGLDQIVSTGSVTQWRQRRVRFMTASLSAAAVAVVAVTAGVVVLNRDSDNELGPANPPVTDQTTEPTPTVGPNTTNVPASTTPTTATTETTIKPTTTTTPEDIVSDDPSLAVSYASPPSLLNLSPFATLTITDIVSTGAPAVAVLDGAAVVLDWQTRSLVVADADGTTRTVPLDIEPNGTNTGLPFLITGGPNDVIYGIRNAASEAEQALAEIVAIPISGPAAGTIVASETLSILPYIESSTTMLGLGQNGIIDRLAGEQLIAYVGQDGQPLVSPLEAPVVSIDQVDPYLDDTDNITTITRQGSTGAIVWPLVIERDPTYVGPYTADSPPAPSINGGATFWTSIGAPIDPAQDFPEASIPVIAELNGDGTVTWYQLGAGWTVAASDIWGTILIRTDGDTIELAHLGSFGTSA